MAKYSYSRSQLSPCIDQFDENVIRTHIKTIIDYPNICRRTTDWRSLKEGIRGRKLKNQLRNAIKVVVA